MEVPLLWSAWVQQAGDCVMTEWLRPLKILEYCVEHWFGDAAEAERQLFQAVIRGEVRARHAGKVLGPEQLRQIPKMEVDASNPFVLSPEVELSVEDAERMCIKRRAH